METVMVSGSKGRHPFWIIAGATIALLALGIFFASEFDFTQSPQTRGISMITTAVVEQAGAKTLPTDQVKP